MTQVDTKVLRERPYGCAEDQRSVAIKDVMIPIPLKIVYKLSYSPIIEA